MVELLQACPGCGDSGIRQIVNEFGDPEWAAEGWEDEDEDPIFVYFCPFCGHKLQDPATSPVRVVVAAQPRRQRELEALRAEVARLKEREQQLLSRNTDLVELSRMHIQTRVTQFHHALNLPVLQYPQVPPEDRVRLRLRVIVEEVFELMRAALSSTQQIDLIYGMVRALIDHAPITIDLVEFVDALCDLDYFSEGTRLEFGIDGRPVLEEVHRANMEKLGGPRRADGKQLKPEGWRPPDIARVLREQGWLG